MSKQAISIALAGVIAAISAPANAVPTPKEKCYGVAKAGKNSCISKDGAHSCAGQAKQDNMPTEWKYVAKGTCEKVGGTVADAETAKHSCSH